MGVCIGSGRYRARSGDILFMDFAKTCALLFFEVICAVVLCVCALRLFDLVLYYLCGHWRRRLYLIWVYVIAGCSPRRCILPGYLGVGFVWSPVDLQFPALVFVHNVTCIRGIVPCSGSSSECRWQLLYQGNGTCIRF